MRTHLLSPVRSISRIGLVGYAIGCSLVLLAGNVVAQPGTWRAYPSLQAIRDLDTSADAVWAATSGGVYSYQVATGEINKYTPVEGLYGVDIRALAYDERRNAVWIGYGEGVLDRIDVESGAVETFFDIARADQFVDRTINRLRVLGDSLYAATAFGVVVFDPVRNEVRDTYSRFGVLDPAISARDVLIAPLPDGTDGLWVATEGGVVRAPLDSPNLQQASSWSVDDLGPIEVTGLAFFEDKIHACSDDTFVRQPDGTWNSVFFTSRQFVELLAEEERLFGVAQFSLHRFEPGVGRTLYQVQGHGNLTAATIGQDGSIWVGDATGGLARLPTLGAETGNVDIEPAQLVIPSGPLLNVVGGLTAAPDGALWVSHERPSGFGFTGISKLTDTGWTLYSGDDPSLDIAGQGYESAHITADGTFYAASFGDGLTEIRPDGTVTTYRSDNSTLGPIAGDPDFVVVIDAVSDDEGRLWVTNFGAAFPLHVRSANGIWTALSYPLGAPTSVNFGRIILDVFGQKWISALSSTETGGRGLLGVSTGSDPLLSSDDQAIHIDAVGVGGTGLPHEKVNAMAFDSEDQLWIGTDRGLATIFSVGSAFGGDPSLLQPQWARTADGTSFLLRDLDIADIAVDPADQKWIASSTGAWLLNAAGDEVLLHFTQENSPLFSDDIVAVAIDEESGRVYFATDVGLLSYDGEATAAVSEIQDLDVAPSPYRPDVHTRGVLISGLVEQTDVRIITLDGQVVASLEGRGGSIRWDGRDGRTGELVSSGVYIVAAISADGRGTAHGKIAVIR